MKSVHQFAKIRKWRSENTVIKNSKLLLECPRSLRLLLPSTQKRSIVRICWNPTWLAWTGLLTATGKPTEIATIEICDKTRGLRFWKESHLFFVICVQRKKTNTLHLYSMCGGIKTLKHNARTTLQLAYHRCNNLTHTSKTRHVKRNQMVVTVRFTIRVYYFLLFHWQESNAAKLSRERCEV